MATLKTITTQDAIGRSKLVVRIKHSKITSIRFVIGVFMIKMAALIIGCGIEISKEKRWN